MLSKKGLSETISTVLIVLLTIAVVTILWQSVVSLVNINIARSDCSDYNRGYFQIQEKLKSSLGVEKRYNCYVYDAVAQKFTAGASIKASTSEKEVSDKVVGVVLVYGTSTTSKSFRVIAGNLSTNELMLYKGVINKPLSIPVNGEVTTYQISLSNIISPFTSLKVYPILKSGKTCDKTSEITLMPCEAGIFS